MYSLYDIKIEITIRTYINVILRLLLRNVFMTALSHFKSFAFSSICSKIIKCLMNDFSFCFNAFKIQIALSLNFKLLYAY